MRVMAIDYGDVRTGVALSDATGFLAGQTFLIKAARKRSFWRSWRLWPAGRAPRSW